MKSNLYVVMPILAVGFCSQAFASKNVQKPNILFLIMDDASLHMGAYGCKWIKTPAFDRVAKDGLIFNNCYTPNAKSAPSRACLLTGRNSWQLEEAANHVANFPAKFKTFPEVLLENEYLTAEIGKGWGPGNPGMKDGKVRQLIGDEWSSITTKPWAGGMAKDDYAANFDAFLDNNNEGKPWFVWFGAKEPHRDYEYQSGVKYGNKKISDIDSVPAFWPDNDIVRNDMLDYAYEIEYVDSHLGKMIASLEKRGLLENTIIVITSDHGMPFPRCKAQEYEYSNHVPLIISWNKGIKTKGRKIKDMISFIDFAPTFLELAGIEFKKSGMQPSPGKSLTDIFNSNKEGQVNPEREYVLIGKERHDYARPKNEGYPIRGIVSDDYLYLFNYDIKLWPAGNPEIGYLDIDGSPTKTEILRQYRTGENKFYWNLSMGKRETSEEFYNVTKDEECMNNLALKQEYKILVESTKTRMIKMLKAQNDPRMFGKGDIFNSYGFSKEKGWNYYERFMKGEFTIMSTNWVNPDDQEKTPIE